MENYNIRDLINERFTRASFFVIIQVLGAKYIYRGEKTTASTNPRIINFNVGVSVDGLCVLLIVRNFFNLPCNSAIVSIGYGNQGITGGAVICESDKINISINETSGTTTSMSVEGIDGNAFGFITIYNLASHGNVSLIRTD